MRTTLTLDPGVSAKAHAVATQLGRPFKQVVNAALRIGLDDMLRPTLAKPYRTKPRAMGLRAGLGYDHVAELLACDE